MDALKGVLGGGSKTDQTTTSSTTDSTQSQGQGGGFMSGLMNKANAAAGGGPESEKKEDPLDKGIDMFQEKVLGQGPQNNESAIEQAKDEQISDFIRGQYKSNMGKDIPIADK